MQPKRISRAIAARNRWTTIAREELELPGGARGEYLIVEREPALMIIALFEQGGIPCTYLVKQHRYPIGREIWQFPMGTLDAGGDAYRHAAEEFRQETGAAAGRLTLIGEYYVDPGLSRQRCLVFIAQEIGAGGAQRLDDSEAGLECRVVSLAELRAMLAAGELNDAWGYTGAYFLEKYLARPRAD